MQPRDLQPEILERAVAHVLGSARLERLALGLARDEDRILLRAESDRDDLGHPYAGLSRHERRKGFVFDLLEATHASAAGRITVGEQLPVSSEPLRVLGVATEHSNLDRTSVSGLAVVLGAADALLPGDPQAVHVDPE